MRKRLVIVMLVAGVLGLAVVPAAVEAERRGRVVTGVTQGFLDYQVGAFRRGETISTSSRDWEDVPGLTIRDIGRCYINEVSTTVSVGLKGGPVGIRVMIDETRLQEPGEIRFDPSSGNPSFNYTFTDEFGETPAEHTLDVQWRSPTGRTVTMVRGAVNAMFQIRDCP